VVHSFESLDVVGDVDDRQSQHLRGRVATLSSTSRLIDVGTL
jgi:hypothetical protein